MRLELGILLGTQLVGTLGPRQCSFVWPLLGAALGMPFIVWSKEGSPSFNAAGLLSSLIFEWKIEWNPAYFPELPAVQSKDSPAPKRKRRRFIQRCLIVAFGALIFGTIFTSALYQNLQVDIKGRRVKVKDVLLDFFKSQEFVLLYQQLWNVLRQLWTFYLKHGLKGIWTQIWMALDSESDKQAFEVGTTDVWHDHLVLLGFESSLRCFAKRDRIAMPHLVAAVASGSISGKSPRPYSQRFAPLSFRSQDLQEKQKAERLFISIQQACDRLSTERKRRQLLNTQKREAS